MTGINSGQISADSCFGDALVPKLHVMLSLFFSRADPLIGGPNCSLTVSQSFRVADGLGKVCTPLQ